MKVFSVLFCLFICASVQASQGFYGGNIINPANPLSVLDPAKRPEIERLAQNLRFFGQLGARPSSNVYVHYQAIQNLLVYPQSPVTALSWMLFPISPLPTINPNNIGMSDPLGKMTPEQLGRLIAVIANGNEQLQELYQIFVDPKKVAGFTANHKENDLKEFYRYALIDGVSKYVHRNMTPMDENLDLTAAQQAACIMHPHLLVTAVFKSTSSHLLEIPGTEILHEAGETWFTQAELEIGLQELPMPVKDRKIYKKFSDQGRIKFRTMATVDMLWKSAQSAPNETLQLLTHYAWRKFGDQIDKVLLASGAIDEAQRPELMRILATPYTKADYQEIVARVQASEDIDSFMDGLTVSESNLLLYGGARYAQIRFQDYGNVRVEHAGRALAFANCAEMSLFNLTHLAQLEEQEMGLERNPAKLLEGSPLRTFWESLNEEDLSTTATRNRWTQTICRLNGVVYRKGGAQRSQWTEDSATTHWAELNPGILNQMRTLFHLLNKPEEAAALTYAGSTETTIEVAALRLSQLLSGNPADSELSFNFTPKEGIKNIVGQKDWYGEFDIVRQGEQLAIWCVGTGHSYLKLTDKKTNIFPLDKPFTNPYVIGQVEGPIWNNPEDNADGGARYSSLSQLFTKRISLLSDNPQNFEIFFSHANLTDEHIRRNLVNNFLQTNNCIYANRLLWGMMQIDNGRETLNFVLSDPRSNDPHSTRYSDLCTQRLLSVASCGYCYVITNQDSYGQACRNYQKTQILDTEFSLFFENRCSVLQFHIFSVPDDSGTRMNGDILVGNATNRLSQSNFQRVRTVYCSFDKTCQTQNVAEIAKLLPKSLKEIGINNPLSPEHFYALATNIQNDSAKLDLYINSWHFHSLGRFAHVPPTQQECAYNLLLPLAKASQPFEPPFIELHTDEDLEPTYEALRIVAAIHKPMPLMLEDGVA